jgi:hypothetical protein
MERDIRSLAITSILVVGFLIGMALIAKDSVRLHELTHKKINDYYGLNSTIDYSFFSGHTYQSPGQVKSCIDEGRCEGWVQLQTMNDITGYNLSGVFALLVVIATILFVHLIIIAFPNS